MPGNARIAIWNVQNFGGANQDDRRGVNGIELAHVIRAFVRDADVDALFLMEVLPAAAPVLNQVLTVLNQAPVAVGDDDWVYDWIKGAFDSNVPYPPNVPANLTWKGGPGAPRVEGYALFWRTNRPGFNIAQALLPMSEGVNFLAANPFPPTANTHYLELVWEGLPIAWLGQNNWYADSGYDPTVHELNPYDSTGAPELWSELDFPWVSRGRFSQPRQLTSRRPAFAVLELIGEPAARRPMPFICYHAPSERARAEIGTYSAALTKQLNVTNRIIGGVQDPANLEHNRRAVIGGDFNYDLPDPTQLDWIWQQFMMPYNNVIGAGGSDLDLITPNLADQRRTTVQLKDMQNGRFNGPPRNGNLTTDYLSLRIDQLMSRGVQVNAANSRVYPFLDRLMLPGAAAPYRAALRRYRTFFNNMITQPGWGANAVWGPRRPSGLPQFGAQFTNWAAFYADLGLQNPRFRTARSAAEFFHIFVSDHLPLILAFQW